jgi:RNA polymerase sigma-70 factor (ECF subfamily)
MDSGNKPRPEQLLAEARQGRRDSLGALLEQYRRYLHLAARMQLGWRWRDRIQPSDLVQETFLQASRHFHAFAGQSEREWRGWLRTILRRRLLRQVHRQRLPGAPGVPRELPLAAEAAGSDAGPTRRPAEPVHPGSSPSAPARRRELADLLAERLARLPAPYRDVLVLRNLEGLPFPEVARRMGRSPGAVRVLWLRALDRLRQEQFSEDLV